MICRALSENKNIIWFRKTGENNKVYWLEFGNVRGYNDDLNITVANNEFEYNSIMYTLIFNENSNINGVIQSGNPIRTVGRFSYTTKITDVQNYSTETQGVIDSLTQRLSLIKGELWYQINAGLPLMEGYTSTTIFDAIIVSTIAEHPGVNKIISFNSKIEKHTYIFTCEFQSIYGDAVTVQKTY